MSVRSQKTLTSFFTSSTKSVSQINGDNVLPLIGEKRKLSTEHSLKPSVLPSSPKHLITSCDLEKINMKKVVAEIRQKLSNRSNTHVVHLTQGLSPEWFSILAKQVESERFQKLADFIMNEIQSRNTIYPPLDQIFSWSKLCLPKDLRVVILGQDPYHGPKQAHGLAFSVRRPLPAPPSLVNMYKEIRKNFTNTIDEDCKWPPGHGDLTEWVCQGVLLLNAVLTVRASQPNSHKDKGWELLTDAVIDYLNKKCDNLVFMLWGASAQKQGQIVDRKRHLVLTAPHPSPLSASRGFFGCNHFIKANEYLEEHGLSPINWYQLN